MKSKKLLTLIIIFSVVLVIIVVFTSVFTVRQALPVYHTFEGGQMASVEGAPTENDVLQFARGKSVFFLDKQTVIDQLNQAFPQWHAIGIVINFPNIVEVHFVQRVAVVKLNVSGADVYLDSMGYVVDAPTDGSVPMDITSAIAAPSSARVNEKGKKFQFQDEVNNYRLGCVLETIMALWQCNTEIEDIPAVLGKSDVFTFDAEGSMTITTRAGAKIYVMSPDVDLTEKMIKAFSVYCDDSYDLQKNGAEITVWPDGKVTTPQQ